MRRRLLASTLTIIVATIAVFGIPLGFVLDRAVHDDAEARLVRDATRVANELGTSGALSQPNAVLASQLRRTVPANDTVIVRYPSGRRVVAGDGSATRSSPASTVREAARSRSRRRPTTSTRACSARCSPSSWSPSWRSGPRSRSRSCRARASPTPCAPGALGDPARRRRLLACDSAQRRPGDRRDRRRARPERLEHQRSAPGGAPFLRAREPPAALRAHRPPTAARGAGREPRSRSARRGGGRARAERTARRDHRGAARTRATGRAGIVTKFDLAHLAREQSRTSRPMLGRAGRGSSSTPTGRSTSWRRSARSARRSTSCCRTQCGTGAGSSHCASMATGRMPARGRRRRPGLHPTTSKHCSTAARTPTVTASGSRSRARSSRPRAARSRSYARAPRCSASSSRALDRNLTDPLRNPDLGPRNVEVSNQDPRKEPRCVRPPPRRTGRGGAPSGGGLRWPCAWLSPLCTRPRRERASDYPYLSVLDTSRPRPRSGAHAGARPCRRPDLVMFSAALAVSCSRAI